jgi:hypothetical protein
MRATELEANQEDGSSSTALRMVPHAEAMHMLTTLKERDSTVLRGAHIGANRDQCGP